MNRVAAIVLAAGGSRRMGRPKQLLHLDGESLVRRIAKTALASRCAAVFVVLGAHAEVVAGEIADLPLACLHNPQWEEGIGSSLRVAVAAIAASHPPFDAVLSLLADQPAISSALLDSLVAAGATAPAGLVACAYAGTIGAPALFTRRHFDALRALTGERGGKVVLAAHAAEVVRIPFPLAAVDLDTPEDYERAARDGVRW